MSKGNYFGIYYWIIERSGKRQRHSILRPFKWCKIDVDKVNKHFKSKYATNWCQSQALGPNDCYSAVSVAERLGACVWLCLFGSGKHRWHRWCHMPYHPCHADRSLPSCGSTEHSRWACRVGSPTDRWHRRGPDWPSAPSPKRGRSVAVCVLIGCQGDRKIYDLGLGQISKNYTYICMYVFAGVCVISFGRAAHISQNSANQLHSSTQINDRN